MSFRYVSLRPFMLSLPPSKAKPMTKIIRQEKPLLIRCHVIHQHPLRPSKRFRDVLFHPSLAGVWGLRQLSFSYCILHYLPRQTPSVQSPFSYFLIKLVSFLLPPFSFFPTVIFCNSFPMIYEILRLLSPFCPYLM